MQVKLTDGSMREITLEEGKRIHGEVSKMMPAGTAMHHISNENKHPFHIDGREIHLTSGEMKMIADIWWELYGKHSMKEFFEEYRDKAAENIRKALNGHAVPETEKEIKGAIAMALSYNNAALSAEVIYESMEWQTAYACLESIEG